MGWIALPNLRALYVAYVDIESNRRVGTNLDRIRKSEMDLHGPSEPTEKGVGRTEPYRRRVHSAVNEIRFYIP
jgi:hypothetical protein